jgi:hypothetical protein
MAHRSGDLGRPKPAGYRHLINEPVRVQAAFFSTMPARRCPNRARSAWASRLLLVVPLVTVVCVVSVLIIPAGGGASGSLPIELTFLSPPQVVTAGHTLTLQWGAVPSGDFIIFAMPTRHPSGFDFSSPSQVIWPSSLGASWNATYGYWTGTASSVGVVIPSKSTAATKFAFQLSTCNFTSGCSNDDRVTVTVVNMATMGTSSMGVVAGTTASLHWQAPQPGDFFLLTMPSSTFRLNFGSASGVTWPNPPGGSWDATHSLWSSTANAVTIAIPQGAPAEASFTFNLTTCNLLSGFCSTSLGGPGFGSVTMTVVGSEWSVTPFSNDFTERTAKQSGGGAPLDAAISPSTDTLFDSNEFSNSLGVDPSGQTRFTPTSDAWDNSNRPFVSCLSGPCVASGISESGERVMIDASGLVWFTQGGAPFYKGGAPVYRGTPNHSEIVAYDPQTGGMCTYGVPGKNPEVFGLAATGSGATETIWFTAMAAQALESFQPSQVGENCATSRDYNLSGQSSFRQIPLPVHPAMVTADPNGTTLWVSHLTSEIDRIDTQSGSVTRYTYRDTNKYSCVSIDGVCTPFAFPWQVLSDGSYAYAIDYGDDNLLRINETTGQMDEIPIPVVSDTEQGYGLTMVKDGSDTRLYFTLSQDPALLSTSTFGMATTFGWVDLTSWAASATQPSQAVLYSGLDTTVSPSAPSDFRGIASGPSGDLVIADSSKGGTVGLIHLNPYRTSA